MVRWHAATRYYTASLEQDLLGDWTVCTAPGGLHNRLGGCSTHLIADQAAGEALITSIHKTRIRHGYQRISDSQNSQS